MRTNVELDDTLVKEAMKISGISTKKAVLNMVLKEYIRKNNLKKMAHHDLWGNNGHIKPTQMEQN